MQGQDFSNYSYKLKLRPWLCWPSSTPKLARSPATTKRGAKPATRPAWQAPIAKNPSMMKFVDQMMAQLCPELVQSKGNNLSKFRTPDSKSTGGVGGGL